MLPLALLLTIIGALVAGRLQQRSWERQYRISVEDAQLERAQSLADKIVELCDDRMHYQRLFYYSVLHPTRYDADKVLENYRSAIERWNKSFGYIRSNLFSIYGYSEVLAFENNIHGDFAKIGAEIEFKYRNKSALINENVDNRLSLLAVRCYQFINSLQSPIKGRSLPNFEDIYSISFKNEGHLDSMYLIKRLYGVSTQKRRI